MRSNSYAVVTSQWEGKNGNAMLPFLTIAYRMTPVAEPLVPLRNPENSPFRHFPAFPAFLANSGGPSLPSGPKWPEWPEVARMVTLAILASQEVHVHRPESEERALFDVFRAVTESTVKSNG